MAQKTWNRRPVGSQRSTASIGSSEFFQDVRQYRYGYETPWIPDVFRFAELSGKKTLEIGVGLGIDAVEMVGHGAIYTGLDVTKSHIELAHENLRQHFGREPWFAARIRFVQSDLLDAALSDRFDRIYSFGVLHHIDHELAYLRRIRQLLAPGGSLAIALYSTVSVFNAYMLATWLAGNRLRNSLQEWRAHLSEGSPLDAPVTIKIRTRREIEELLTDAGLRVQQYSKRGFVQNYLPVVGKRLRPNGRVLNAFGSALGWYHCFICESA